MHRAPPLRWRAGCGERTSPAHPVGRLLLGGYSLLLYSLCYISFQNSTPRAHNAPRLKGAADSSGRAQGRGGRRALIRQRGTSLRLPQSLASPSPAAWGCSTPGPGWAGLGGARGRRGGLSLIPRCPHY
ncbi:hypothetical protein NN561_020264 [Cricetulus griseus]